jgi:mRNA interferase MazF
MPVKQFELWIADLNPRIGTEPGKRRPVLTVQTNLLNRVSHPSTLICPLTTNVNPDVEVLRIHIDKGTANLRQECDIMIDQVRAIDNNRLVTKIGVLPAELRDRVSENLRIVLDL